ncbi:uncharacterized protein [Onthophagus taurus]|uniref:uncharacterized protein n=1 Tax=Onthophagus taurus TaxID=166361 RepID=UPI000C2073CF|nr:uncharacterized protein LOC111421225 [Onthophagus taurus]
MRFLLFLIIVYVSFEVNFCWTSIGKNPDDYSGTGCKVNGVELAPGEIKALDYPCSELFCTPPTYRISGCATISGGKNCKIRPGDLDKPYPNCCPLMECVAKE